jgi:hypothetical protein
MSFKAEVKASVGWSWNDGALDNDRLDYSAQLLEGNGDGQAEAVWHLEDQTLLSGASSTLDLTLLARTVLGDLHTVTLLKVKALLIVSAATSVGRLLVGGAAADEWSEPFGADGDQIAVPPGSPWLIANRLAGWDMDDSHKNLKLAASAGDVDYSICIVGTVTAAGAGSGSGSGSGSGV